MKRTKTIALLITIMIALITFAGSCFDFINPGRAVDAWEMTDELIDGDKEGEEILELNQPDDGDGPEDWYIPQVPFTELYDNPQLRPLDWFFDSLYPTAMTDDRAKVVFTIDPNTGQLIYSIEGQVPGLYLPQVDQVGWGYLMLQYDQTWSGPPPDAVFPCDQDINILPPEQDWFSICPGGVGVSTGNSWHVVYTIFDAPIPWGDQDHSYTYAAVFDADGLPDNNFQFMDPYNWDYYQNTDQWYILDWTHKEQSWNVYVLGENWENLESNSRVVVHDNAVFWLFPEGEFAVPEPGGRVSSFATTGGWDPGDVGGDVNGNDPTEPLTPVTIDPIHVMDPPFTEASIVLDDDYETCGAGLCKYNEKTVEQQKTEVWCTDAGCSGVGGECSLFSRLREDSPQDPDSWSYVAGSNTKMQKDWTLVYHCYCVK